MVMMVVMVMMVMMVSMWSLWYACCDNDDAYYGDDGVYVVIMVCMV